MNRTLYLLALCLSLCLLTMWADPLFALDPPHNTLLTGCLNCHNSFAITRSSGGNIDNTITNMLCRDCHDGSTAKAKAFHSSSSADSSRFGVWTTECVDCHNPHYQKQVQLAKNRVPYDGTTASGAFLTSATVSSINGNVVTVSGVTGWSPQQWVGLVAVPNKLRPKMYRIANSSANALTVKQDINTSYAKAGDTLTVVYGKNINDLIYTGKNIVNDSGVIIDPNRWREARLLNDSGVYSPSESMYRTNGVCVICHTKTRAFNIGYAFANTVLGDERKFSSAVDYANQEHQGRTSTASNGACWSKDGCHRKPEDGFVPDCMSCHGQPPVDPGTVVQAPVMSGRTAGAHEAHLNAGKGDCMNCHKGGLYDDPLHKSGLTINMGFTVGQTQGQLTTPATLLNGFTISGYTNTTIVMSGSNRVCTNIYCHSDGSDYDGTFTYTSPDWDTRGLAACNFCHGDATRDNVNNAHPTHVSGWQSLGCFECHACTVDASQNIISSTLHINGAKNIAFGNTGAGGLYMRPACTNVYCHSNGKGAFLTPQWTDSGYDCGSCHGFPPDYANGGAAAQDANSHEPHVNHGFECAQCHEETITGDSTVRSDLSPMRHLNGERTVTFNDDLNPDTVYNGVTKTCSNIGCHGGASAQWGDSGSFDCSTCHGKDADKGGVGTTQSHSTHTEADADDIRGPLLVCADCHDTNNFPYFKEGVDANLDGKYALAETTVCTPCHSPGGSYDGLDDPVIGARTNWTNGIYSGDAPAAGKEKWCAGCHDLGTSVVNGISAPPVIGNETASYTYGTGYGYYKTGHGLQSDSQYPASGGLTNGASQSCTACHDLTLGHLDGIARSFGNVSGCTPDEYRLRYRLNQVGAANPMQIPLVDGTNQSTTAQFPLCYQCHNNGPFTNGSNDQTNFYRDSDSRNLHNYHLTVWGTRYSSDWENTAGCNSRITCVSCHNVHGSENLAMVRDGHLTDRDPMGIWYYNQSLATFSTPHGPANPASLTLAVSNSVAWAFGSAANYCSHCHSLYYIGRQPFQDVSTAPVLGWAGTSGFVNDGVNPDSGFANTVFEFRISYSDANNDAPDGPVQLLIDTDDTDACNTPDLTYDMSALDPGDTNYYDGKVYSKSLELAKDADNTYTFCYNAADAGLQATGAGVANMTLPVWNYPPVLSWEGSAGYETDGVAPNGGAAGTTFVFKIKYTDYNNDAPDMANLVVSPGIYNGAMDAAVPGDTNYTDGKVYEKSLLINAAGDYTYRFSFTDADGAAATGQGIANIALIVNTGATAPELSWSGGESYTSDGVHPDVDTEELWYTFRVKYTDADNDPPGVMELWVDLDDSGTFGDFTGEQTSMNAMDAADTDYTDGKLYELSRRISFAGAGATGSQVNLAYRFYAEDDTALPTVSGAPVSNSTVGIINGIVVPTESATIQSAITAAATGQRIVVNDGTYGRITVNSKVLDIKSVNGPSVTTIYSDSLSTTIYPAYFMSGGSSVLSGFSIVNGAGRGIYAQSTDLTVDNCAVANNAGDGINFLYATPLVSDTVIRNNGRGIYFNGTTTLTLRSVTISNNISSGDGGGINMTSSGSTLIINGSSLINGNTAATRGGGIYLNTGSGITMQGAVINGNSATGQAGGLFIAASVPTMISDTEFSGNTSGSYGGAIYCNKSSDPVIVNSTFTGNRSTNDGGAIMLEGGGTATLTMKNVMMTGNRSTGGRGGAVMNNSNLVCSFCTLSGNRASTSGGAIFHMYNTRAALINTSILYGNSPEQIYANWCWSVVQVGNSLINQAPGSASNQTSYNSVENNDISSVPGFVNAVSYTLSPTTEGDYHLQSGSAAINYTAVSDGVTEDFEGDARPYGSNYDIGADEFTGP